MDEFKTMSDADVKLFAVKGYMEQLKDNCRVLDARLEIRLRQQDYANAVVLRTKKKTITDTITALSSILK